MLKLNYINYLKTISMKKLYTFWTKLCAMIIISYIKLESWEFYLRKRFGYHKIIFFMIVLAVQITFNIINNPIYCDAGSVPSSTAHPPFWYNVDPINLRIAGIDTPYGPGDHANLNEFSQTTKENIALREAVQESMAYKRMENLERGHNINAGIAPSLLEKERILAPDRSYAVRTNYLELNNNNH